MAEKNDQKLEEIEHRRLKGGHLLLSGIKQAEVARMLGVKPQSVAVWVRRLKKIGRAHV